MKIIGIALGVLILIGCATGLILTFRALGATQDRLAENENTLSEVQAQQQNTRQTLEETQDKLAETAAGLEEQKSETDKYIELYENSAEELKDTQNQLDTMEDKLAAAQREKQDLQKILEQVQEKLALYEDTLGIQVFADVLPPYNTGYLADLALTNNSTAKDPTWKELLDFLFEDRTDKKLYVDGVYMCGSFAEEVHNNAEAHGIRAAFVAIHFYNEQPHAINAFKTTDRGLVYIDDTGLLTASPISHLDRLVEVTRGEIYHEDLLFPEGWEITGGDAIVRSIEIYW
jgi:flagellar biosynthesis GTPase FlhF